MRRLPDRRFTRSPVRPLIIGLTGSIGMGKSRVAAMFRHLHVPTFDADAAVHWLQRPQGGALPLIEAAFPGTTSVAGLDRARLGAMVFGNAAALKRLEGIMHPLVQQQQARFLRRHRSHRAVVLDVPLLLEGNGWKAVDVIAVVSAPAHVQRARVMRRPGMTAHKLEQIRRKQMPDSEKRRRADVVIETGRGLLETWRTVSALVRWANGGNRSG